jgi:hypothetical protein
MELQREVIPVRFYAGFYPDQNPIDGIEGTIFDGENVWIQGYDRTVSDSGPTLFGASGGGGLAPLMVAGGVIAGFTKPTTGLGYGSVTSHNNTDWFAGKVGESAYKNGALLGASAGRLYLMSGGVPLEAGLDAITGAAVIDANGAASTQGLSGTYSLRLAPVRLLTGAKGNTGPASNTVPVNKKKIRVNIWPSTVTGQTHWAIYISLRGYGLAGPHFLYKIITLAEAVTNYEIDFSDSNLSRGGLAPFTSGKPPACTHCAGLGPMMVGIGGLGGYGITPSLFNLPEEYDPAHYTFLAKKEAVTGVGSGSDGSLIVATRNSLSGLVMSGNDFLPVLVRGIWENTGFAHGNGFTIFEDQICGMAGNGPVMSQGSEVPDTTFATPVLNYLRSHNFTADNTHVCHDYNNNCFFLVSGNRAVPYMRGRRVWSSPIRLSGTATGAVTINGQGLVQVGGNLFSLNTANSGDTWYAQGVFTLKTHHRKTARYWKGSGNAAMTIDVMANKGASVKTLTQEAGHSKLKKFAKKKDTLGNDIQSLGVKVSGTTGKQEFQYGELTYLHEPAMR